MILLVVLLSSALSGCYVAVEDTASPSSTPAQPPAANPPPTIATPPPAPPSPSPPSPPHSSPTPPPKPSPTPPSPAASPTTSNCHHEGEAPATDAAEAVEYDTLRFGWEYEGDVWEWQPAIPKDWWDYYASRVRPGNWSDYGIFATDPYDDPIIEQVVCILREAADNARYTEYERVEFTLAFVQSLQYVQDQVGTGFDEWPKFPLETLVDEGGDCEDTSILLATLLRAMGYDSVLLLFPRVNDNPNEGHAAVGIYSQSIPGGTYWTLNERNYYYIETTNGGWKIGQLPDAVTGQKAQVIPLVPRAALSGPSWEAPEYENGTYRFEVTVSNIGSAPVEDLVVWGGWDAGGNRAWSATTWDEGYTLQADGEITVTFWLEPPPSNVSTRSWFSAWGSNAVRVSTQSEYFQT